MVIAGSGRSPQDFTRITYFYFFKGAKALEAFIYNIKNDPDKASNMPRDGTVHELTNHVRYVYIIV